MTTLVHSLMHNMLKIVWMMSTLTSLLSDLSDNSPMKSADNIVAPPPEPHVSQTSDNMKVLLRISLFNEEEKKDEGQVRSVGQIVLHM